MSVKIVDVAPEKNGLSLTPEGRIFFNQFRAGERLKFISFIGAGRVGKSWLASRFAEHVWYDTVLSDREERREIPVPWTGDIFFTRGEGEAVTKGIWAFALRPNDNADDIESDSVPETDGATSSKSPAASGKSSPDDHNTSSSSTAAAAPSPTIVILDCEGSDNLLDSRQENTIAKQIQAISFFLAGRGSVVFVETDRLRTQSIDDLARILDVKLEDDDLYTAQQLFVVVNKETLGSSFGLEQLLHKDRRQSCVKISEEFDASRRNFHKIPTFFERSGHYVTYSDLTLEDALDQLFSSIQKKTPVSSLGGPECARAVSGYLNMDALEEHLREMVKLEVADYTRDILPIIVVSTSSGGGGAAAAAEQQADSSTPASPSNPVTQPDWSLAVDDALLLNFEKLCKLTLPDLTNLLLQALERRPTDLPVDPYEQLAFLQNLYQGGGAGGGGSSSSSSSAAPQQQGQPQHLDENYSKFDASLQVSLTKFQRKPYVRYAAVRAPQIVSEHVKLLEAELSSVFLKERHLAHLAGTTKHVLQTLVEMFVLQLESDTLEKVMLSSSSTEVGSGAAGVGSSARPTSTTTATSSSSVDVELTAMTGSSSAAASSSTAPSTPSKKLKSIAGESVKVRSLLSYDSKIIDKLLHEFRANPVVQRVRVDGKTVTHPNLQAFVARSQALVTEAEADLERRLHAIYVSEVNQNLDKLVTILLERLQLPAGMFGFMHNASYDDSSTQAILRDFEHNHSVQSVKLCLSPEKEKDPLRQNATPVVVDQSATASNTTADEDAEEGESAGKKSRGTGRRIVVAGVENGGKLSQPGTSQFLKETQLIPAGSEELEKMLDSTKASLLKETVEKYRHKLRYAVQERIRMHNEKILTQLIGMFRC
eukprot:g15701.t1